tara:strand:+ start:5191 stop:5901 length:711 start_codon:yes stop_codon:yes gene_type:complete
MKTIFSVLLLLIVQLCSAQIDLLKVASTKASTLLYSSANEDEVAKGLREALVIGADKATESASAKNGFYLNNIIRIPFPPEAEKMKITLQKAGMQSQIKNFEKSINSAAELATKQVLIIFVDAINNMGIQDAFQILKGENTAATSYLRKKTSVQLYNKIKPLAKKSIQQVEVTKYWNPLVKTYNTIPFTKSVQPDLEDYVTNKTIEGIFILIANQEKEIRNNPKARTSELLQKVFK